MQGPAVIARVGTDCATELLSHSQYRMSTPWRQRTQKRNCAHRAMLVNRSQVSTGRKFAQLGLVRFSVIDFTFESVKSVTAFDTHTDSDRNHIRRD